MSYINTLENDIELLYIVGYVDNVAFYSYKDYKFSDLKKGDKFRLKSSDQREMTRDFYGYEVFTCASDSYYDYGWKVALEDE